MKYITNTYIKLNILQIHILNEIYYKLYVWNILQIHILNEIYYKYIYWMKYITNKYI